MIQHAIDFLASLPPGPALGICFLIAGFLIALLIYVAVLLERQYKIDDGGDYWNLTVSRPGPRPAPMPRPRRRHYRHVEDETGISDMMHDNRLPKPRQMEREVH